MWIKIILWIVAIIFILTCIYLFKPILILGGQKYNYAVIDTLNLSNYLHDNISEKIILADIKRTSQILADQYFDLYYVIKSYKKLTEEMINEYKKIAKEYRVNIVFAEHYLGNEIVSHSSKGRDDFVSIYLANKFNCDLLSNDRFKDYRQFKTDLDKILVYFIYYKKDLVSIDYINPKKIKIWKPKLVKFTELNL